jgi:hypothetical protein
MKRVMIALALTSLVAFGLVASCKQGEGERCQVDDDCEDPLVCAQATQTCADNDTSSGIDAMAPMDAPDAPPSPDAPDATVN